MNIKKKHNKYNLESFLVGFVGDDDDDDDDNDDNDDDDG
jgi:hypothetical protein